MINIRCILLGCLGLTLLLSGCKSPEGFELGEQAYLVDNFAQAERHLQDGLREDDDEVYYQNLLKSSRRIQAQDHLDKALTSFSRRDYNNAQQSLENALAKDSKHLVANLLLLDLDSMMEECQALVDQGHEDLEEGRIVEGYRSLKLASSMDKIYPNLKSELEEIEISTKESAQNVAKFQFDQENYKEALEAWSDYVSFAGIDAVSEEKIRESLRGMKVIRDCSDIQKFMEAEGYAKAYEMAVDAEREMPASALASRAKRQAGTAYATDILERSEAATLKATELDSRPDAFISYHASSDASKVASWENDISKAHQNRRETLNTYLENDIRFVEENLTPDDLPVLWALEREKLQLIGPEDENSKQRLNQLKELSLEYTKVNLALPRTQDPQEDYRMDLMFSALEDRRVPHLKLHHDDPNSVTQKLAAKNDQLFQQTSLTPLDKTPRVYKPILDVDVSVDPLEETLAPITVEYFTTYQFSVNEQKQKANELALVYQREIDDLYHNYSQLVQDHEQAVQELVDCQNVEKACSDALRESREMKSTQSQFISVAQSNNYPSIASSARSTLNEIEQTIQTAQNNYNKAARRTEMAQLKEGQLRRQLQETRMKLDDFEGKAIQQLAIANQAFSDLVEPQFDVAEVQKKEVSLDASMAPSLTLENTRPHDKPIKLITPPVMTSYTDEVMTGAPMLSVDVGLNKSYQYLNDWNDLPSEEEIRETLLCRAYATSGMQLYEAYLELLRNDLLTSREIDGRAKLSRISRYWLLATDLETNTGFSYVIDPKITDEASRELVQVLETLPSITE